MLRLLVILFVLSAGSAAADTARIATWNLGGFSPIPDRKIEMIVKGLEHMDADIVVLSELNPASRAQDIAKKLSEPAGSCYKSVVPEQPRASQEIGFLFKCHVSVERPRLIVGSNLDLERGRNAAVVDAKIGEFDFVLIGLHLKSSRGVSDRRNRSLQAAYISGYVQGIIERGEWDILVIGDYNMIPGQDAENFRRMNGTGALRFVSSEDLADKFSHIRRNGKPGNLLDGFAFTTIDEQEYQEGSVEIVQMHDVLGLSLAKYRNRVTDHLPIVAVFKTDVDHDQ